MSGPERLTTGLGIDSNLALSREGTRLAFVARTQTLRLWSLPFDAAARRTTGEGQPLTPPGLSIEGFDVSADGRRLAFVARRPGKEKMELWSRALEDGRETMIGESGFYFAPRLSRDGALLALQQASPSQPGGVRILLMFDKIP